MKTQGYALLFALLFLLQGCGKKTGIDTFVPPPPAPDEPVLYVPISQWTASGIGGLNRPTDLIAGYDELIYVVDSGNNRIVQFDQTGRVVGISPSIPRPKAIAQTRNMQLLVTATADSLYDFGGSIGKRLVPVSILYRLDLLAAGGNIGNALPERLFLEPLYVLRDTVRILTGIATLYDNSFYVSRSSSLIGDSSDVILRFNPTGQFVEYIAVFRSPLAPPDEPLYPVRGIYSLSSFAQPPQSDTVDTNPNFFFTTISPQQPRRFSVLSESSRRGEYVAIQSYTGEPPFPNGRFLNEVNRFKRPTDAAYDAEHQYYLIVDAETDSLHQYNTNGFEGVFNSTDVSVEPTIVSFSAFGNGDRLNAPEGVCHFRQVLYISDTGNNRVLRFKLSTDIR